MHHDHFHPFGMDAINQSFEFLSKMIQVAVFTGLGLFQRCDQVGNPQPVVRVEI